MESIPLAFFTSFFVVLLSCPALIKVAILKQLFDEPDDERKLHAKKIPSIGGIMIFAATLFAFSLWLPTYHYSELTELLKTVEEFRYLRATILILFFVGIKDDIIGIDPLKKLVAHILVGMILVLMADVRLTGLHGLFGIQEIPYWASVFLSLFTYIVVVNAFNLIDGIDGLAAGVGLISSVALGAWFMLAGEIAVSVLAFSLAGSLLAFLIFNFSPAKIFMGDSGSLTIGIIICFLSIKLVEHGKVTLPLLDNISKPVFVIAVLIYPLYDTLRVFIIRSLRGLSPFSADRNHIHHRLIDIGLDHRKSVLWIYTANISVIGMAVLTKDLYPTYSFLAVVGLAGVWVQLLFLFKKKNSESNKSI